MKISFIEPHLKLYGGIRRIVELANRLKNRGNEVTIFHSNGSPCTWMPCVVTVKRSTDVLKENHEVIIYNHPNPIDYYLVKRAKAIVKVFYVLELYERDLLIAPFIKIFLKSPRTIMRMLYLKKSLKSPFLKLSNATWMYQWLKGYMSIDSELVMGGINTEIFHPVKASKNLNEIKILCSGDPRPRKGTATVQEAIGLVKKQFPQVVLDTYYGKGIPQQQMAYTYSSADIFVDAQVYAGWNNPVAEAMACKVPVVCTDIGAVHDIAFHEKTALLVSVDNPQGMAAAIIRLIKDDGLRQRLQQNAYEHIRQFNWDDSAERLENVLRERLRHAYL